MLEWWSAVDVACLCKNAEKSLSFFILMLASLWQLIREMNATILLSE